MRKIPSKGVTFGATARFLNRSDGARETTGDDRRGGEAGGGVPRGGVVCVARRSEHRGGDAGADSEGGGRAGLPAGSDVGEVDGAFARRAGAALCGQAGVAQRARGGARLPADHAGAGGFLRGGGTARDRVGL